LSRAAELDLAAYRDDHVADRIERALTDESLGTVDELRHLLRVDEAARRRFRRSIAVSVSGLFRDPDQFELLEQDLLPKLMIGTRRLRVWSAGCADGSELYSVAIILERLGGLDGALLLGSDLLEENLGRARAGVYGEVTVPPRLRAIARWEQRDLVRQSAPPGKWNLVLCRNLAIYLAPAAKRGLHETLAGALALGGVLVLGRSERLADPRGLGLERAAPHAYRKVA
jgi:chemotaxis protein methyltransferase CheR